MLAHGYALGNGRSRREGLESRPCLETSGSAH